MITIMLTRRKRAVLIVCKELLVAVYSRMTLVAGRCGTVNRSSGHVDSELASLLVAAGEKDVLAEIRCEYLEL